MDGALLHVREEGWKEVKVIAVSAVDKRDGPQEGEEREARLNLTSYRAGLWEAAIFADQQWAESCRRGLEKARRIVCVDDSI